MRWSVTVGGTTLEVELSPEGIRIDGTPVAAELRRVEGTDLHSLILDGISHRVLATRRADGRWEIDLGALPYLAEVMDERTRAMQSMAAAASAPPGVRPIRAPMPGLVVKVEVAVGERVEAGQGVVIMEAMKMENELRAEAEGVVSCIHVAPGQRVEKDQLLMEFDAPAGPGEEVSG